MDYSDKFIFVFLVALYSYILVLGTNLYTKSELYKNDHLRVTIENLQKANRFNEYRANRKDNLYKDVVKELKYLKERNKAINETNKYLLKEYIKVIRK